ncbi:MULTISPECIES: hypothetical protein [unclassified Acinetobacter]|uniref:hypothetical protein n=1 Tax=unclassified Acinetobacter TaxID=196816 RepID=UPI0029344D16|nr:MULTISPECIES: hypothetical protein [unclassified Acinetobacter]WOE30563.1 hypothetical protein QSG84_09180 [Acinetobacter sp. SAAs470]WOE38755.1 hypothetical protein QSG86_02845 [Acinetobacter sp. SAAs474]
MSITGIKISAVEMYHPATIRDNDFYLNKFEDKNQLKHIFNKVGRNTRFVIDNKEENSLTMAMNASEKLLK